MTFRDRDICDHCGHRFRSGLGTGLGVSPLDAPFADEDALHRTMQFTLPPLPPRGGGLAEQAAADAGRRTPAPPRPGRRGALVFAVAAGAVSLALLGAFAFFHHAQAARAVRPSPAGGWETTLAGRSSENARLRFVFGEGGGGSFSWAATGAPPVSGQAPLRWRLDPDGRLVLTIPPPASADAASGTLIAIFNSHPWLWRVDRPRRRLILGTLSFQEIP